MLGGVSYGILFDDMCGVAWESILGGCVVSRTQYASLVSAIV